MLEDMKHIPEKVSIWFEWRRYGKAIMATIQYEEPDASSKSRNGNCIRRERITQEEAAQGYDFLKEKYPCP